MQAITHQTVGDKDVEIFKNGGIFLFNSINLVCPGI